MFRPHVELNIKHHNYTRALLEPRITCPRVYSSVTWDNPPPTCTQYDSLELTQERINAITDKIPQRPVGVVEGTSYTLIILAAFGVCG